MQVGSEMPHETFTFRVSQMSCEHCAEAVGGQLRAVAGVSSVSVDLDGGLVLVSGTGLNAARLRQAIDEAGYEVD
jgi:copper chaperone